MHTRTGDSSAKGSGSSVAAVVTVGLGTSPWVSDQIVVSVPCSVEQCAAEPLRVVPVLPSGEQFAPITTGGDGVGATTSVEHAHDVGMPEGGSNVRLSRPSSLR